MCGITGAVDAAGATGEDELHAQARRMAGALAHRGPDDHGTWVDAEAGVALGHRRLSVVDLSPLGHQPMTSADGRWVLVFNGEVYDHRRLRSELEALGTRFRGASDTEVLLEAIARWGVPEALRRSDAMLALAAWDRRERRLWLACDRFGEKPLYYGWCGSTFLFGSELRALRASPAFSAELDRRALAAYLRHGCVPAGASAFQGIRRLPGGTTALVDPAAPGSTPDPVAWWSAAEVAAASRRRPLDPADGDPADLVEAALSSSVALRMVADVPVGAFLSGGIDSSLVVALMQQQSPRPVRTFTIGFDEPGYDESAHARAVARHLGTDHHELRVTGAQALEVVPRLPAIYDEPFADSSQIPTSLVAQLARRHVTVALSGDGGDELFGGYPRYGLLRRLWRPAAAVPLRARRRAARLLASVPEERWDRALARLPVKPALLRRPNVGAQARRAARALGTGSAAELYLDLMSHWPDPAAVVLGGEDRPGRIADAGLWGIGPDVREGAMLVDAVTYLPDDILVKVDRAAMAVSLETRVPLLGPEVFELAWRLPVERRVGGGGKPVLKEVLRRHVPGELVDRPKMGFGVPLGAWLRGPLRDWAEAMLDERRLRDQGLLDATAVRRRWDEHVAGTADHKYALWDVLVLQGWLEAGAARP